VDAIPILSFFTGGGLLDIGFELAGFRPVWTNEVNEAFVSMYAHAMTSWRRSRLPTCQPAVISSTRSIEELVAADVLHEAFGKHRPPLFGAVGGPPCPDFSAGGRNGGSEGEYGRLTRTFMELVCAAGPQFFVMENVAGLCRIRKHRAFLREMLRFAESQGYAIDHALLNALELGIPQDRERLFVVGIRRSLASKCAGRALRSGTRDWFSWPQPTHPGAKELPWPAIAPSGQQVPVPDGIPLELTVFPLLSGDPTPTSLPNGDEHFVPHSAKFRRRAEGDVSGKSFKRLHRYRYSPTAWYGNNEVHLHPWEPRRLSVREALRIQTVPDEYVLPSESTLGAKFKLIANGVPCRLARRVAESLRSFLRPAMVAE
jgi:DNA (cytosine-5)-methyltransferase 1